MVLALQTDKPPSSRLGVVALLLLLSWSIVCRDRLDVGRSRALGRAYAVHGTRLSNRTVQKGLKDAHNRPCQAYLGGHNLRSIFLGQLRLGLGSDLLDDMLEVLLLVVQTLSQGW